MKTQDLFSSPNALVPHYSKFRVHERLLFTGHSHQAWPDVGFEAQQQAWLDAAEHVGGKWAYAFDKAEAVRNGYARLLGFPNGLIALASNTHDLVIRFLSALPLRERPRIVTTDGEFHTIRRQLDRLSEEGIEVVKITAEPLDTLAERLGDAADDKTAAVMVSAVFFKTARIVAGLGGLLERCKSRGVELLVDTYHALNVMPYPLNALGLEGAFVVGGGYKYCQLGEGNCFLYFPEDCALRPVITGWYSEFAELADSPPEQVAYGRGAARFAGATYDPTSHYRAAAIFDFHEKMGLTPEFLREVSQHQVGLLAERFDALDAAPKVINRQRDIPLSQIGGFLMLKTPHAGQISAALKECGVFTDFRETNLRFGPAPYLSDAQIIEAIDCLGQMLRKGI